MGYHKMKIDDLYSIFNRWIKYQKITHIAAAEGFDRKTIRTYISQFKEKCLTQGNEYTREELIPILQSLLPLNNKKKPVKQQLIDHRDEIKNLLNHPDDPVKIYTAFKIIRTKYSYKGSYETFKLFVKEHQLTQKKEKSIIRIELPAGLETQVDYGKVGTFLDPKTNKNRTLYAFCGILSHSRLPYIEFTFTQNQESFTQSHINMFEHFKGTTEYISLDNLKAGVIKPDLYDPKINRSYQEMAEHYGVFINPCRVATPTDKGKVERFVQVARELFKELKHLHPDHSLQSLNQKAREWCKNEYGQKEHGTTRTAPIFAYEHYEKAKLKPLPAQKHEVCSWVKARVQRDQFIQVSKKRYSLPAKYIGAEVWVKQSTQKVMIYQNYQLIRIYIIPHRSFTYEKSDFPDVLNEMLEGGYPNYLLNKARLLGNSAYQLIENILTPHAYLNARRARGALDLLEKYRSRNNFDQLCQKAYSKGIKLPKSLKIFFEEEGKQQSPDFDESKISERGKEMIRGVSYYLN